MTDARLNISDSPDFERFVALKASCDLGEATREEQAELSRLMEANPEVRAMAGDDIVMQRALGYFLGERLSVEGFTRGVVARIEAEAERDHFVGRVHDRIFEAATANWRRVAAPLALAAGLLLAVGIGWWHLAGRGMPPADAVAQVSSGKGEKVTLRFAAEDTVLQIGENTVVKMPGCELAPGHDGEGKTLKSGPQKVVEVVSGSVNVVVAKQQEGRTFVVRTDQAEVMVVGTRFSATVAGGKTMVEVKEGVVRVRPRTGGMPFSLRAGMKADVEEGMTICPVIDLADARLVELKGRNVSGSGFAAGGGRVWICEGASLIGLDQENGTATKRIDLSSICMSVRPLTWHDGALVTFALLPDWRERVFLVNTETGAIEKTIYKDKPSAEGAMVGGAIGDGCLWLGRARIGVRGYEIDRIDLATGRKLSHISTDVGGTGLVWMDGSLWVVDGGGKLVALAMVDQKSGATSMNMQFVNGHSRGWWRGAAVAPDGSLWLLHTGGMVPVVWRVGGGSNR